MTWILASTTMFLVLIDERVIVPQPYLTYEECRQAIAENAPETDAHTFRCVISPVPDHWLREEGR